MPEIPILTLCGVLARTGLGRSGSRLSWPLPRTIGSVRVGSAPLQSFLIRSATAALDCLSRRFAESRSSVPVHSKSSSSFKGASAQFTFHCSRQCSPSRRPVDGPLEALAYRASYWEESYVLLWQSRQRIILIYLVVTLSSDSVFPCGITRGHPHPSSDLKLRHFPFFLLKNLRNTYSYGRS